ncbi:MAG: HIT family protein [bacterium]|nr:HIT family protein [bacterium]
MEDSIFTKIIKGEIPCHKIYEDDNTLAFLDIHPFETGQTVVVPKTQINFVWDLESDEYLALMATVQKIGTKLRSVYPNKKRVGVRIEGLDVNNHAHVVVFPFDTSDEFNGHTDSKVDPSHDELAAIADKLRIKE